MKETPKKAMKVVQESEIKSREIKKEGEKLIIRIRVDKEWLYPFDFNLLLVILIYEKIDNHQK